MRFLGAAVCPHVGCWALAVFALVSVEWGPPSPAFSCVGQSAQQQQQPPVWVSTLTQVVPASEVDTARFQAAARCGFRCVGSRAALVA